MSKVRIYELAREAGIKSKDLVAQLVKMGYPVKSHSSTVDDDMAAEIRRKVLNQRDTGVAEKRIRVKKRTDVVRKKTTTVVRRRSRAQKEEIARQREAAAAEEEVAAAVPTAEEELRQIVPGEEEQESALVESAGRTAEIPEEVVETTTPAAEALETSETGAEVAGTPEAKSADQPTDQPVKKDIEEPKAEAVPIQPARPKSLAKVVGRVDIQVASTPERTRQRPGRGASRRVPRGGSAPPAETLVSPGKERKKKKGKRVVAIGSEEPGRGRRMVKGRRGRQQVDFFSGQDVEYIRTRKVRRKKDKKGKSARQAPVVTETKAIKKRIRVLETISVGDLAKRMGVKAGEVIARLMGLGVMATVNQALDLDTATLVASDFGYEVEQTMTEEQEVQALQELEEQVGELQARPPVVTVMGHVDHGKTSILDAIRKTDVAAGEAGGITQHIGAYHVQAPSGDLTFVDTPGHAAFTEMRSRGAKVTDIVILVVAADDGVMDQTREAIAHAQAAEVPIVVAINKIDKDNADPERVRRELGDFGLIPEEWGGDTIYCETSAKKKIGIDELLEQVQLLAEILELQANPAIRARGVVIEAQLHKGRGPVATVLVKEGTLHVGDYFVAGLYSGKVRRMVNDRGQQIKEAGPAIPVEIQGLTGVPQAGDAFVVLPNDKMAKSVAQARQLKARESELASASKVSLDNLFEKMAEQDVKELRVVLRSDVQGTLEAFAQAAEKLSTDEIKVRVLHAGTGSITENDVHLASASNAIIIGFNVRPSVKVKELAEREKVDIRSYDVIYHALEDIEKAMVGMLEPTYEERVIGTAEVRDTFQVPKVGTVAGCAVIDGKIERHARVRVLRDGVVVYTGNIASLKRFKDDVKEVLTGYECGIGIEQFNDVKIGDQLEAFVMEEVEATLRG